jgi:tripartite-type tricarboxylate transporter receptor subunit TctC
MFCISVNRQHIDVLRYLFGSPGVAVRGAPECSTPKAVAPRSRVDLVRRFGVLATLFFGASINAAPPEVPNAAAERYPHKAIHLIAVYSPGGLADLVARIVATALVEQLGTSVIVDNKAGAGGRIGVEAVVTAPADGYTLGLGTTGPLAIEPVLDPHLAYDPRRDLAAISLIASAPQTLVAHPSVPAADVRELIAYARANPGMLNYASPGVGTTGHLAGELFKSLTEIDIVHVPYKGNQEALKDVLAGRVQLLFSPLATVLPFAKSGKLRVLAVAGYERSALLPEVPTIGEAGVPGAEAVAWYGLIAPRGTSAAVIRRLNAEVASALARSDVRKHLQQLGAEPASSTPEAFANLIRAEMLKWRSIVVRAKIRPDL